MHLDTVFVASSNEAHLNAFKEYPDFPSFKGRMALIKMPYIRDFKLETEIYDDQIQMHGISDETVPHATYVLGLWSVLTRLKRPAVDGYHNSIKGVLSKLTVMEKAELIAKGKAPSGLSREQTKELQASLPRLLEEGQDGRAYEGSTGASPREMKDVMLNALQDPKFFGLNPLAIVSELRSLVKLRSVFDFLKTEPNGGYHDFSAMIDTVLERYLDRLNADLRASIGLVTDSQYEDLFARYIQNVKSAVKGEKVYNASTGRSDLPDSKLMNELESVWKPSMDAEQFRSGILSRVAAWRIDNPGKKIDYSMLFPDLLKELSDDYYEKQKKTIKLYAEAVLNIFAEESGKELGLPSLASDTRKRALGIIDHMVQVLNYPRVAIPEVLTALVKARY